MPLDLGPMAQTSVNFLVKVGLPVLLFHGHGENRSVVEKMLRAHSSTLDRNIGNLVGNQ